MAVVVWLMNVANDVGDSYHTLTKQPTINAIISILHMERSLWGNKRGTTDDQWNVLTELARGEHKKYYHLPHRQNCAAGKDLTYDLLQFRKTLKHTLTSFSISHQVPLEIRCMLTCYPEKGHFSEWEPLRKRHDSTIFLFAFLAVHSVSTAAMLEFI